MQYFDDPDSIPVDVTQASSIKKPTGRFSTVGSDIDRHHNQQFLDFDLWWSSCVVGVRDVDVIASIDYETQMERIKRVIDAGQVIPVALGTSSLTDTRAHAVLAYDYKETQRGLYVRAYNPNYKASEQPGGRGNFGFNTKGDSITVSAFRGFDRVMTLPQTPHTDEGTLLAASLKNKPGELFNTLLQRLLQFELFSPATLTVTCPDGGTLTGSQDTLVSETATQAEARCVRYGAPAGEYTVTVTGEASGDYTLRAIGTTPEGSCLDGTVTGRITEGETHTFRAVVPEDGRQGSLEPANTAAEQVVSNDTTTREVSTRTRHSDRATPTETETAGTDTDGLVAVAAGAAGSLAALTGWRYYRKNDE